LKLPVGGGEGGGGGGGGGGGEIFRTCPDQPWSPSILLYNGYWLSKNRAGTHYKVFRAVALTTHHSSSAEAEERVVLYF